MKKLWQMIKGCPLFSILIISGVIVTAGGYVGAALGVYKWDVSFHHPMAQTVLLDERVATGTDATSTDAPGKSELTSESTGSEAAEEQTTEVKSTEKQTSENASTEKTTEKSTEKATTEKATTEKATIDTGGSAAPVTRQTQYKKVKKRKARNSCYRDLTQIALETQYPYIKVDKSYFDDALFIGDSRVEGLALYSGLDNAEFAYMEGLTSFGLMGEKIASNGTKTLTELLKSKQFRKIYIMLGINEAGYDTETYASTYIDAVAQIQALQPDAVIFMMGCMHVSSDYSASHDIVNNDNIDDKNGAIAAYADGIKLFYLDMNTVVDDGRGGLVKDYTWDDIHLQAQYYSLWEQYLYEHGLKDDAFK